MRLYGIWCCLNGVALLSDSPRRELERLEAVAAHRPTVALIDFSFPDQSGLAAMSRVYAVSPTTAAIIIANQPEDAYRRAAFDADVAAYLLKRGVVSAFSAVLEAITNGA